MVLAVAAATPVAAASDRFVPADPAFVVAELSSSAPDAELRQLLGEWRAAPAEEPAALALAAAYLRRARALDEPRFQGRAEAVLAPFASRGGAHAETLRMQAQVLQFRHEFAGAQGLLDRLLREHPHDADARLRRAALRLTRGDFAGARADCAQLAAAGSGFAAPGFACLAQSLASQGDLRRARGLLHALEVPADRTQRSYLLATRAELAERAGEVTLAANDYREALRLTPDDDALRASLADLLVGAGHTDEAASVLAVDRPSLGLLVRRAALAGGATRQALSTRAHDWLRVEAARGDAGHHREAALLALATGDDAAALTAASRNFDLQRELCDVRLLARAAVRRKDPVATGRLRDWLLTTGFEDVVTQGILASGARG
jgi:tetratricopeptide (TPR) repeat protein